MSSAARLDHPAADVQADLPDDAEDVPLGDRRVGTDDQVRSAQRIEVSRVIGDEERAVEQLAQELGRPRRIDPVDGIGGLGRGQVMGLRADAADPVGEGRHLLDRPTDAERLEPAQLRDLEIGPLDVALLVEEDLDLAVALESGDRVDRQARHRSAPWVAAAIARRGRGRSDARGSGSDRPAPAQQRAGQAEAIELADRIGQAVEDAVDLRRLAGVDDRRERGQEPSPEVDDAVRRPVAADARRTGHRALRAAAVARRRAVAREALLEEAQARRRAAAARAGARTGRCCLIPRSRRHSSQTVEWPAPRTEPSSRQRRLAVERRAERTRAPRRCAPSPAGSPARGSRPSTTWSSVRSNGPRAGRWSSPSGADVRAAGRR